MAIVRQAYTIIGLIQDMDFSMTQEFDGGTTNFAELLEEDIEWLKSIGYTRKTTGKQFEKPGQGEPKPASAGPNLQLPGVENGLFSSCTKCKKQSTGVDGISKSTGNPWSGFKCTHCGQMDWNKTR